MLFFSFFPLLFAITWVLFHTSSTSSCTLILVVLLTLSCIYVAAFHSNFLDCALLAWAPGYNQWYHLNMAGVGLCDTIKQSLFLLFFHLSGFPPSILRNQDILSTQGQVVALHESTGFLRLRGKKQQKEKGMKRKWDLSKTGLPYFPVCLQRILFPASVHFFRIVSPLFFM